jgi:hypothetical protein
MSSGLVTFNMEKVMAVVEVPEQVLRDAGIIPKFYGSNLAVVKAKGTKEQYNTLCRFNGRLKKAKGRGIGLTIYGEPSALRTSALYGVAKAAIAQGFSVVVASLDDIVQGTSDKSPFIKKLEKVDFVVIPEMMLPQSVVNSFYKAVVYRFIAKRIKNGLPVIVATELELEHPEYSVDLLYAGVARLLIESTLLLNFTSKTHGEWLQRGHAMTLESLADFSNVETTDEQKEVKQDRKKPKRKLRFKLKKKVGK